MLRILKRIYHSGLLTENEPDYLQDPEVQALGSELKTVVDAHFNGSLAIRAVDAGSCNACELEIHAINGPHYDIERFGVHFVASPRHADVLLVTGPVSRHMETAVRRTWRAMAAPRFVIACGDCACNGGEFGSSYASCGAVENVIPVDLQIAGCPPSPVQLMRGILALMQKAKKI
ncbi:MAG: NADH-quinone oxidoreductase subunit B family protein [gamma proteobacterium symbiont of Bathyaustriella thionipta]|nr:NADH-quinone oxidoreductase subunit B family protein [gamma proteobacterium symbiont of Bathyaustriella thionipta]